VTDLAKPEDYDAPGLRQLKRPTGRIDCYWVADKKLVKAGYPAKTQRLHGDLSDPINRLDIAAACRRLQAEMLEWKAGRKAVGSRSERGTIRFLCEAFEGDEDSPIHGLRDATQVFYRRYMKIIIEDVGAKRLSEVNGKAVRRWHAAWAALGHRGAYACIQTLRRVIGYGVECAENKDDPCLFIARVLQKMEFDAPKGRKKRAEHAHVAAFRPKATEMGRASIALAVSMQFDLGMRQKDVIGEWVRAGDGTREGIMDGQWRWQWGVTWDQIDKDWILRKPTSKSNGREVAEHDLKSYPETLALLQAVPAIKRIGPVIIDEGSRKPYRANHFGVTFRKIANASGWPADVWNMDSRAGAISEAFEAGAEPADVMKAATHTEMSTTMGYNRGSVVQSNRVAELRLAKRKKAENAP
jgi:hypothetical protein